MNSLHDNKKMRYTKKEISSSSDCFRMRWAFMKNVYKFRPNETPNYSLHHFIANCHTNVNSIDFFVQRQSWKWTNEILTTFPFFVEFFAGPLADFRFVVFGFGSFGRLFFEGSSEFGIDFGFLAGFTFFFSCSELDSGSFAGIVRDLRTRSISTTAGGLLNIINMTLCRKVAKWSEKEMKTEREREREWKEYQKQSTLFLHFNEQHTQSEATTCMEERIRAGDIPDTRF